MTLAIGVTSLGLELQVAEKMLIEKANPGKVGTELLGHGLDWWNGALLLSLVIAAFAAFAVAAATTGVIIAQKRETLAAQQRVAESELKLQELRKLSGPRDVNFEAFKKELEGKPRAPVEIWYIPDSSDGYWFASRLRAALGISGWQVEGLNPTPIPEPDQNNLLIRGMPRAVVAGGQPMGVTVVGDQGTPGNDSDMQGDTPFRALFNALAKGTNLVGIYGASGSQFTPLPKGTLRVVIAAKADPMFADTPSAPASNTK
jgi:hypothetical protein